MLNIIFKFFLWLDRKRINEYSYETAPYCGYHYSGHKGYWTSSSYHEGDGGEEINTWFGQLWRLNCDGRGWGFNTWILNFYTSHNNHYSWFVPFRKYMKRQFSPFIAFWKTAKSLASTLTFKQWFTVKWVKLFGMVYKSVLSNI